MRYCGKMTLPSIAQSLYAHNVSPPFSNRRSVKVKTMASIIDHEMLAMACQLWPSPQHLQVVMETPFSCIVQVKSPAGKTYLKRFTDTANSGDFPSAPTSAAQRCLVAANWHELALSASARESRTSVPRLVAVQTDFGIVAMERANGEPLYHSLVGDGLGISEALAAVTAWLGALHSLSLEPRAPLLDASQSFKAFKIELQYTGVLSEMPQGLHAAGKRFAADYLKRLEEPVHGALNSRNILSFGDEISVIGFEQGHFGEGVYDLAYLLSEYIIRELQWGLDPETTIMAAWIGYYEARNYTPDATAWQRLRIHLGFQTLYRLVGPSRQVWTGHLDDVAKDDVRHWSISELSAWLL